MRIIRFLDQEGRIHFGQLREEGVADVLEGDLFSGIKLCGSTARVAKLLVPLVPSAILCIGLNYHQHAREFGAKRPDYPVLFMKNPASILSSGEPIVLPPSCMTPPQVDFEAELAVVIGKAARNVPVKDALHFVLGYAIGNDVSARQWQKKGGGGQWVRGKSFDTFCPLGPGLVTTEEITDPQVLKIRSFLNGRVMQDASTSEMIFSVAELIADLSRDMTLLPGTVILTGTPAGVGFARTPPVYLKPGDRIEIEIGGIGRLVNPVVAGK